MLFDHRKEEGFSLVEVIIAMGISTAVFLYLNKSLVALQKTQVKMERRAEISNVKRKLRKALSDIRAWEEHPGTDVPKPGNQENFYYFPGQKEKALPLTLTADEYKVFDKEFGCPFEPGCRVVPVTYQGRILGVDNMAQKPAFHLLVIVHILTPPEDISRSFLPRIKVTILDNNEKAEFRLRPQEFFVNDTGSTDKIYEEEGKVVDPVSRSNCFSEVIKSFPDESVTAASLCSRATSTAPAACYKQMRNSKGKSAILSQVVCDSAVNLEPIKCFNVALGMGGVDETKAAILCSGASSMEPVSCYNLVKSKSSELAKRDESFKICARARDTSPAKCLINIAGRQPEYISVAMNMCPHHK